MNNTNKEVSQTDFYKMFLETDDIEKQIKLLSSVAENEVLVTYLGISIERLYKKRHQILSILKHILSHQELNNSDLRVIGELVDIMVYLTSFSKDMRGYSSFKMEIYSYLKEFRDIEVINEYLDFLNS